MKKTIVYYHPRNIKDSSDRGSDVRVKKMLDALGTLGHDIRIIAGDASARHRRIRALKSEVNAGLEIAYVYGECTNAPIMLADKRLIPSNCMIDYLFFSWLKKQGIPLGVFYRDIYWRFGFLQQQLPWPLSTLLKPLYYLDWYMYNRFSDVLFLPSQSMNRHLPHPREANTFQALPPGYDTSTPPRPAYDVDNTAPLELLYVGGLEPTVYDISTLLKIIARRDDAKLTLCCRPSEWQQYRSLYEPHLADNIEIVHAHSSGLSTYYHRADVFLMVMNYSEYMDFAAPVKFFEAIGYAVPVIAKNYKEAARHIRSADFGWVLEEFEELDGILSQLSSNRAILAEKYQNLLPYRDQCSWESRAHAVDDRLLREETHQQ